MPHRAGIAEKGNSHSFTGTSQLARIWDETDKQHLPRPYTFTSVEEYKAGLRKVGEAIRASPNNDTRQPIVIGITG